MSSIGGSARSVIKSLQTVTVSATMDGATHTATISSVNVNKALLSYLGSMDTSALGRIANGDITLTNATTITYRICNNTNLTDTGETQLQVLEYF